MKARHAKKTLTNHGHPGMVLLPVEPMVEGTASFSMNLQCDEFDPRMKYQKVEFFQSQKVTGTTADFEARFEAAYEFCKKVVFRRYKEVATAITSMRHEANHYPLGGAPTPHPVGQANARAFEEYQKGTAPRRQVSAPLATNIGEQAEETLKADGGY